MEDSPATTEGQQEGQALPELAGRGLFWSPAVLRRPGVQGATSRGRSGGWVPQGLKAALSLPKKHSEPSHELLLPLPAFPNVSTSPL